MPLKQIPSTPLSREREALPSNIQPSFAGKKVCIDKRLNAGTEERSRRHDEGKSIHERSVSLSANDALSTNLDTQSKTDSFHSAVEFLEDRFPAVNNTSVDSAAEAGQSQTGIADYRQGTMVNQEAVEHLERADSQRLNQYIDDFSQVYQGTQGSQGIASDLREPLQTMVDYGEKLDTNMNRLQILGQKLQTDGLSDRESLEMKALIHCNKYNLSFVQSWLSATMALRLKAEVMNEPTATLFTALSNRFAMRHMDLADTMSLYEDRLPSREPLSRGDRIGYNLLTARAGLRAFKIMTRSQARTNPQAFNKMKNIYPSLVKHCKALEHAARLAKGQINIDAANPQLKIESLDAWTEDLSLTTDEARTALPRQAVRQLTRRWDEDASNLALSHPRLSQRDTTHLFIEYRLKKSGVDIAQLPKFETAYEQALITEINLGEWPVIDKGLQFEIGGKRQVCRSKIVPGAHLAKRFEKPYKSNGVSYMDRLQTEHAPNMAHTRLIAEDGETLFSGVRHGILDSYNYNSKKVRDLSDTQLTRMAEAIYDDRQKRLRRVDTATLEQQLKALEDAEDNENDDTLITLRGDTDYFGQTVESPLTASKRSVERHYLEKQIELRNRYVQEIVSEIKNSPTKRAHYLSRMRNLTSRKMAGEILSAVIVSNPAKLDAALKGETVDLTMNSIALVTPDWLRARYMAGGTKDERRMLQQQVQALQSLARGHSSDNPVRLTIKDDNGQPKEIKVNLKVRTFNFGVNEYALAKTVLPANTPIWRSLMGWGFSADLNDPQLNELLGPRNRNELGGAAAEKLHELEQSKNPKIRKRAVLLREAATQAKDIWRNRSFWSGNNEPYKMVSRLALTSHLMDEDTVFNCKSGKDRTGQLDAEVKYLAAVGHATGHIPEPDIAHTAESRRMRSTFTLDAGNMELQRMNTGLPGYKLRNIPGLEAMLEEGTKEIYEGGSDFV